MPDLARLQSGDEREWQLLFDELDLDHRVVAIVYRFIGGRWPQHVEDVAATAIMKFAAATKGCAVEAQLLPLLKRIARQEAISFLRRGSKREVATAEVPEFPELNVDNLDRLRDSIAAHLGHERFDLQRIVAAWTEAFNFDQLDRAILEQHIIQGVTQKELSAATGTPEGTIARRKSSLLGSIRRWLPGL